MPSFSGDNCIERSLFGGAISSYFPLRFQDVSDIRQVPDHQEVFVDPTRDESLIFELLEFKHEVEDSASAAWFLRDLASEQDAEESMPDTMVSRVACILVDAGSRCGNNLALYMMVLECTSTVEEAVGLRHRGAPALVSTAVGQMALSKGRQGREAQNIVRVYLANLRLKEVDTDVLITSYEPILINPLSESASAVGAGPSIPAAQAGCLPVAEIFKLAVTGFKVHHWNLFNPGR